MSEATILTTSLATPIQKKNERMLARPLPNHSSKPNIKSRKPQPSHIPGLGHNPVRRTRVSSPPTSTGPSSDHIETSTLSGHSAIDVTMTPDSNLLLRESISVHRTPSLHSAMPLISAAIDV